MTQDGPGTVLHQHPHSTRAPVNPHFDQTPPEEATTGYLPTSIPTRGSSHTPTPVIISPPDSSPRPLSGSLAGSPARTINIHSLTHIQQLARDDVIQTRAAPFRRSRRSASNVGTKFEISEMPVTDVIEMVAGLLTKITTTNDRQHEHLHRHIPPPDGTSGLSQQTSSVLAFHGKNVPSITILSYLSRIHKYCPTTYEVFLSLLVYFDRMTERVNSSPGAQFESARMEPSRAPGHGRTDSSGSASSRRSTKRMSGPGIVAAQAMPSTTPPPQATGGEGYDMSSNPSIVPEPLSDVDSLDMSHFFVVDSFNIHRLVIAGVTCASKFFSDVFYTNSRYAKVRPYSKLSMLKMKTYADRHAQVGGLPLVELNHLEIQFLLLNDFRLSVPVEELEAYGTMLVEFYAREVTAQPAPQPMEGIVSSPSGTVIVSPP